jgi:hypothetical protein
MDAVTSLFKKRRTPEQVVALLAKSLAELDASPDEVDRETARLRDEIAKRVGQARIVI